MPESAPSADRRRVVVIGGGLAGLAAASVLAPRGFHVTLLESRPRLGGRASSIVDRETGRTIDNCQHVTMGCCTSFRRFCETTGCADLFQTQRTLHFVEPPAPDRAPRIVPFRGIPLPAPAHLSLALARMPWFRLRDKRIIASGLRALARDRQSETDDSRETFAEWLTRHNQPESVQSRFWHTVLVSALSETLDRISVRHACKVFVDGFLANRRGWEVSIPVAPLGKIYDERIARSLTEAGVEIRTGTGARQVVLEQGRANAVELRDGSLVTADEFVLAVPHWLCLSLLPEELGESNELRGLAQIETAPIASAHLWFDRPLTALAHAVLLDRTSQWFFNRGCRTGFQPVQKSGGGQVGNLSYGERSSDGYCQVVISAARELDSRSEGEILNEVEAELKSVWPQSREAKRLHGRVLTEHRAVFAPLPGVDDLRPAQQSSIENLQLAGDWTQTGWPSTMEGAVRSGFLAARNVLGKYGTKFELPGELPQSLLFRLFFS